ncbi:type IV pilus biogenesis protein PilM [Stenotrophomonas maltophilia]|uniref:type IV pilus biogenesis protein PilM n=1 Tax=Stenotrophomonas maltophilia TaxID=40324 RepID=UPI000F665F66|nr:type IV pilus biogenesis protein PilM [Stenotrophomonas maltophilia]RRU72114.1 hypothetical protein EGJ89_09895 [Stenotrophomonas maltophilia]
MNSYAIAGLLAVALAGAGATTYAVADRKAHHDEVAVYSDHIKMYANYVSTAARSDTQLRGTLTAAQLGLPEWIQLDKSFSNYVENGNGYAYFMPRSPALGNEIARSCTVSSICGLKNSAGKIVQPGSGDASVAAPATAPLGAMVVFLGAGAQSCVVPDRDSTVQGDVEAGVGSCPAGQAGQQQLERFKERTATGSCPDPNGPLQWSYSGWSFSDWKVKSSSCVACPSPSTGSEVQWISASQSCPAGYLGQVTFEKQQVRSRSITYNCPSGTQSVPGPTYGAWSGWADTGSTRNTVNSCQPACNAPGPSATAITRWAPDEAREVNSCPAGQVGTVTQVRSRVENGTRTTTWHCPAATGSPVSSTSDSWHGTYSATSGWSDVGNSCKVDNPPIIGQWEYQDGSWGYGAGPSYDYNEWNTAAQGSGWCGNGGQRPPQGNQSCHTQPNLSGTCTPGDWFAHYMNEGFGGGVEGSEQWVCY